MAISLTQDMHQEHTNQVASTLYYYTLVVGQASTVLVDQASSGLIGRCLVNLTEPYQQSSS